jgi:hypothetical protein
MKNHHLNLMKKNSKPAILVLFFLLILQSSFGQARINVPDYISRKFISYCKSVPWEDVYLHTDRDEYIAGEELWFNVYAFDRQSQAPSLNSRLVYVEVVSPDNKQIIKARFELEKGCGPGQILLPDTLSSGLYTIRAYTGWMKNFLPENCFTKNIRIYNAISSKPFRGGAEKYGIIRDSAVLRGSKGISVKIDDHNPDTLEIRINADKDFINSGNENVSLFIETHGNINLACAEKLNGEITRIKVPRSLLMPGITHITLFDQNVNPICERFIYSTVRDEKQKISIKSNAIYKPRSKVSLEIDNEGEIRALTAGNLSISVSPMTGDTSSRDIGGYLLFGSEFGELPWDILKDKKIDELSSAAIDSLVSDLKSSWIRWSSVLASNEAQFMNMHESENHYLSGKLEKNDQQPAPYGEPVLLSIPGKVALFQYALTDSDGNFSFPLPIDEEMRDLVIQPGNNTGNYRIIMETSFSDLIPAKGGNDINTGRTPPSYISEWSSNFQVARIYGITSEGSFLKPLSSPLQVKRFYGKPELEIRLDDYISLPVMEEVFFELLPRVILKSDKSGYELYMVDPLRNRLYKEQPVMMVNGVIFNDPAVIGKMDPALVEKIDAIREKYVVGDYQFPGIVNVITKSTDYKNMTIPANAVRIPYTVAQQVASFKAPDYSTEVLKNSRVPDFRNTLYWNPSVKSGNDGKYLVEFWSSDFASDYIIKIEGISTDGKIISLKKTISIR